MSDRSGGLRGAWSRPIVVILGRPPDPTIDYAGSRCRSIFAFLQMQLSEMWQLPPYNAPQSLWGCLFHSPCIVFFVVIVWFLVVVNVLFVSCVWGTDFCLHYIEVHHIALQFASWLLSMCFLWVAPERNFHWHWGHYVLWRDRTLVHCASSSADTAWCDISVTGVSIHTAEVWNHTLLPHCGRTGCSVV